MVTSSVREKQDIIPPLAATPRDTSPPSARAHRIAVAPIRRRALSLAAATLVSLIAIGLALAPLVAFITATWATVTALNDIWRLATLIQSGQALDGPQAPALLASLETAGRAGFLATGYLALIFGLITFMAGLFGRRWGRLFIMPGATLTITALGMLVAGLLAAQPLVHALPFASMWLAPLVVYALADAILVSGALVDTRLTRSPSATGKTPAVARRSDPLTA